MRIVFGLLSLLLIFSCKTQQKVQQELPSVDFGTGQKVTILDSTAASQAIIVDNMEGFFEHINILDMSIQMKASYSEAEKSNRAQILSDYKAYLQKDVTNFTPQDIELINKTFKEIYELSNKLNTNIFPQEIKLIKTHGTHYGNSVYYTRENCIVIPKNELESPNPEAFLNVMIHELFHIYSRLNPQKRAALYQLIGFTSVGGLADLKMVDSLRQRVLLNPDGVNFAQSITLQDKTNGTMMAIPIILANEFDYRPEKASFFSYLAFELYQIKPPYSRLVKVLSKSNGDSLKPLSRHPDFHRQIRDNTGYIIHPDEVLADNFIYLLLDIRQPGYIDKFSEEGRKLLAQIKTTIQS
ncbi:MAG: hypothetical protein AAGG75_22810 [Bacteroidota bacterium]